MSLIGAGRKCVCCNGDGDCPYCACYRGGSDGYYCYAGQKRNCTSDDPPENGHCCEILCNGKTGPLTVRTVDIEWTIPHACRDALANVWGGWTSMQNWNTMVVTGLKIVGNMYYYARVELVFYQYMPGTYFLNCDELYAWKEDSSIQIRYFCQLKQARNAEVFEMYNACHIRGGDLIYTFEDSQIVNLALDTRIPDITVFNESAAMEPYLPRPIEINWEFYPGFIINTLKKGQPCG